MAEFKVGDRVRFTYRNGCERIGTVKKNDGSNYRQLFVEFDGSNPKDGLWLYENEVTLIDPQVELKKGDKVKIVAMDNGSDGSYLGKIGTVSHIEKDHKYPVGVIIDRVIRMYSRGVLEKVEEEKMEEEKAETFKVGDRVKWTYEGYSGTGIIVKHGGSDRYQWHVKRDTTGWPLNDVLILRTSDLASIDSVIAVGDVVKIARPDNATDNPFVGKIGKVVKIVERMSYPVLVNTNGSERWYSFNALEKNPVITEHHGFSVGDVVAVRGSGFTGKIVEFGNANRPGGITVVVVNDRGERRGITTTDIEKALSHKTAEKQQLLQVDDKVKVVGMDVEDDRQFVGRTGVVSEINTTMRYHIGVQIDGYGFRRFSEKCLEVVAEKPQEEKKFKVGDKVKIIIAVPSIYKKVGVITEDDGSSDRPLNVNDEHGNHIFWCEPEWLEKVGEVKPVDDWRARFEAFKASHPVGTEVKIVKKVTDDEHARPWVASMDKTIGRIGVIESYDSGNTYAIRISSCPSEFSWNYPMDALEDVTKETNQYTFTVKPSDVDLDRIWREANADFAVVVDYDKRAEFVWLLYRSMGGFQRMSVQREIVHDEINRLKAEYENEKKQRVTVTIY